MFNGIVTTCAILLCLSSAIVAKKPDVRLINSDDRSFEFQTGDYVVKYAPFKDPGKVGWIVFKRKGIDEPAIATKLANGQHLNVTDAGTGTVYRWKEPRKDRDMFRHLSCRETPKSIEIEIKSERRWAKFDSRIWAYKKYPGLIRWTVTATAKADKAFDGPSEPDCHFMVGSRLGTHQAVRYMVQRGPAAGIVYFRDLDMKSDVFYFEDFSSMNDLYRLTGFANPSEGYQVEGQPGAVKMGQAEGEFQWAEKNGKINQPWQPYKDKIDSYKKFGYERPRGFRIPKGKTLVLVDTYLYLRPTGNTDTITVCKNFTEMLARVYQYIYKPPIIKTDWAGQVVPRMAKEIMLEENSSLHEGKYFFPRAYVRFEHKDKQLWNLAQLLVPLTRYVEKYPDQEEAVKLKKLLDKSLPLYYDKEYKGFSNNLPPVNAKSYDHTIYIFNPAIGVADLALMGNKDAKQMLLGYRDRLLEMGRKCDYVFANVWLEDYSKQNFAYQFDNTCGYIYVLMSLYDLTGGKDKDCLAAAEAAAEQLTKRCMDLMWEINLTATGPVACEWLYEATGNERYRDIAYIPLANALRWAWLWECDYGIGEHITTFWAFCGTPAAPQSAEYESHQARRMLKAYTERAKSHLSDEVLSLVEDSWRRGPTQSRFAMPPFAVEAGAKDYIVAQGPMETDCGEVLYDYMIPLEDFRGGWGTDLNWYNNNAKIGHVGQEIYGAGGPIWYALWQDEIEK